MTERFLLEQLEKYRSEYEAGDATAFHEAILFAAWNNTPIPEWAVPKLEEVMNLHASGAFKRRKGVASDLTAHGRHRRDQGMHGKVLWLLNLSPHEWRIWGGEAAQTLENAFGVAASMYTRSLVGKPGQKIVTAAMVKTTYYRIAKAVAK